MSCYVILGSRIIAIHKVTELYLRVQLTHCETKSYLSSVAEFLKKEPTY